MHKVRESKAVFEIPVVVALCVDKQVLAVFFKVFTITTVGWRRDCSSEAKHEKHFGITGPNKFADHERFWFEIELEIQMLEAVFLEKHNFVFGGCQTRGGNQCTGRLPSNLLL